MNLKTEKISQCIDALTGSFGNASKLLQDQVIVHDNMEVSLPRPILQNKIKIMKNLTNLTKVLFVAFQAELDAIKTNDRNKSTAASNMEIVSIEIRPQSQKRSHNSDSDDDTSSGHKKTKQARTEHKNYAIKLELKMCSDSDDEDCKIFTKIYEDCLEDQISQESNHGTITETPHYQALIAERPLSPCKPNKHQKPSLQDVQLPNISICMTDPNTVFKHQDSTTTPTNVIIMATPEKENMFDFEDDFIRKAIIKSSTRLTCLNSSNNSIRSSKKDTSVVLESPESAVNKSCNDYRSCKFVFSLLKPEVKDSIRSFIVDIIGADVLDDITDTCTHLIVHSDDDLICAVTAKYLKSIANKIWIISAQWALECMNAKRLIDMAPFEIRGDSVFGAHHGPQRSRLSTGNLFDNYQFLFFGKFSSTFISSNDLVRLARVSGAIIVEKAKNFQNDKTRVTIFDEKANNITTDAANFMLETAQIYSVNASWFFDSLACHQVKDMKNYALYSA
jgi:hypothetical protein